MKKKITLISATLITSLAILTGSGQATLAGVKKQKHPTIIMKSGNRAGLQYLYAWDFNCRPIKVQFKAISSNKGRLYTEPGTFRITRAQSKKCAGRLIRGKKVVFRSKRRAAGTTTVRYRIASQNVADTFEISRQIKLRK